MKNSNINTRIAQLNNILKAEGLGDHNIKAHSNGEFSYGKKYSRVRVYSKGLGVIADEAEYAIQLKRATALELLTVLF